MSFADTTSHRSGSLTSKVPSSKRFGVESKQSAVTAPSSPAASITAHPTCGPFQPFWQVSARTTDSMPGAMRIWGGRRFCTRSRLRGVFDGGHHFFGPVAWREYRAVLRQAAPMATGGPSFALGYVRRGLGRLPDRFRRVPVHDRRRRHPLLGARSHDPLFPETSIGGSGSRSCAASRRGGLLARVPVYRRHAARSGHGTHEGTAGKSRGHGACPEYHHGSLAALDASACGPPVEWSAPSSIGVELGHIGFIAN